MKLTPIRAIKQYCKVDCCNSDLASWKFCVRKECPLYAYRLGKRPKDNYTKTQNNKEKHADSSVFPAKNDYSKEGLR